MRSAGHSLLRSKSGSTPMTWRKTKSGAPTALYPCDHFHSDWRKKRSLESKTLLVQLSPAPEPHIEETGALSKTSERCRRTYLPSDSHCTVGNHETLDCVVTNTCVLPVVVPFPVTITTPLNPVEALLITKLPFSITIKPLALGL